MEPMTVRELLQRLTHAQLDDIVCLEIKWMNDTYSATARSVDFSGNGSIVLTSEPT